MPSVYGTDVYAYLVRAREQLDTRTNKDGRTIVELQLTAANVGEIRLFYTPVRKALVSAAERLGDILHHRKADLDEADVWWKGMRGFLEDTFTELEFASAGTLLAPPMMSGDKRQVHVQSFVHRSNPQNNMFDRFVALPRGTYLDSRIHLHSSLPDHSKSLLNSWRVDIA